MSAKENFYQAVREIFPFASNKPDSANTSETAGSDPRTDIIEAGAAPAKAMELQNITCACDTVKRGEIEVTRVTKNTKITGTILSESSIEINGEIFGDVESRQRVTVTGKVEGDIKGKNVDINSAAIKGNITASEYLHISSQSTVVGNISADKIEFNGRINGNISVKNEVTIQKESFVVGDISAIMIGIEKGAVIKGSIITLNGNNEGSDKKA